MKYYDIVDYIKELEYDEDPSDLRLHYTDQFYWYIDNKEQYEQQEETIDSFEITRHNYIIYAWYDISGYDYWTNVMKEHNYIQITVSFETDEFKKEYIVELKQDLEIAIQFAHNLEVFNDEIWA